ncbi:MAG: choice-of-anchor J domain-containing protein, partial [candidate division WOR-3 bacterium]
MKKYIPIMLILLISGTLLAQTHAINGMASTPSPTAVVITESFEGTTFPPTGWSQLDPDGPNNTTAVWYRENLGTNAYDGSWVAALRRDNDWLITPLVNIVDGSSISYWAKLSNNNDGVYVQFKYSTDYVNWYDIGPSENIPGSVIGWTYHSYTFNTNIGPAYIAFAGTGNANGWMYIDYVQYNEPGIDITFDYTGINPSYTGTVLTVTTTAGTTYYTLASSWPVTINVAANSNVTYSWHSPLVDGGTRNLWSSTTGTLGQTLQSNTFTVTTAGTVIGNYSTQYLVHYTANVPVTVPPDEWVNANDPATGVYTSPQYNMAGTIKYVYVSDDRPSSITGPTTINATYDTYYWVTYTTNPAGLVSPSAEWVKHGDAATGVFTTPQYDMAGTTKYVFTGDDRPATITAPTL